MKKNRMQKLLCLLGCIVLVAAMALTFTGCGSSTAPETTVPETTVPETTVVQTEAATGVSFLVVVTGPDGAESTFDITTDKATVGEALLEEGLIAGEDSEFGLYVTTVNGITLDWDKDQQYWAFYIDGEYAMTGVDSTEVTEGAVYSFAAEG